MPNERPRPTACRVLLVEGQDDLHVVEHLRRRHWSDDDAPSFDILDKKGIDPLLKSISTELKVDGREVAGILADANDNLDARWQSIRNRMQDHIDLPEHPAAGGVIVEGQPRVGIPRVGVWLMPDNALPGELEDFVIQMIPDDDPVWPQAQRYIAGIAAEHRKFAEGKEQRAALHAWLSTRRNPQRMGTAIDAESLKTDGALCQQFVDWLRRLFA